MRVCIALLGLLLTGVDEGGCGEATESGYTDAEIADCCRCLTTTVRYEALGVVHYCYGDSEHAGMMHQCEAALGDGTEIFVTYECRDQLCAGSCPMLDD